MNRRWICGDVWMDILPSFDRPQLGLKMALLSDRFDILVDAHFDGKSELTLWREIRIGKDSKFFVEGKFEGFPMPDRPLPNKIRFYSLKIQYIDHSVIEFLHANKQILDRSGTNLFLGVCSNKKEDEQPIWNVLARKIWPIFATNVRHLCIPNGAHLDNLRRLISSTFLTDCDQLNSIDAGLLFPDGIADDGPNATAGQALTKWLHTPTTDGQPNELYRYAYLDPRNLEWVNNFKETFLRATTSVSYTIQFFIYMTPTMPTEQFELVNGQTKEKLTLKHSEEYNLVNWLLQRCPIIGEVATTAAVKWKNCENSDANFNYIIRFGPWHDNYLDANLNNIRFDLWDGIHCIGPLSPPTEEEKADQSNENVI